MLCVLPDPLPLWSLRWPYQRMVSWPYLLYSSHCSPPYNQSLPQFLVIFHSKLFLFIYALIDWLIKVVFTFNASEPRRYIHPLELDTEYVIQGVKVTLLEANHCPGAALLHFRLPTGLCYLHTGDFRASKLMQAHPLLANNRVNVLYLDTTYCNPKYK